MLIYCNSRGNNSITIVFVLPHRFYTEKKAWKAGKSNHSNPGMKTVIAFTLVLVVAAQAADWHKILSKRNAIKASDAEISSIVGGKVASPVVFRVFPFQVAISIDGQRFCGGSLIKEDQVLTAARCCSGAKFFEITLGANNLNLFEPSRQIVHSYNATVHEQFDQSGYENDICIIHLEAAVRGEGIDTIRLPSRSQVNENFVGYSANVSGWGFTANDAPMSSQLVYTSVIVLDNNFCKQFYKNFTDKIICTYDIFYGSGICDADSGGPLTIIESDGVKTQVGIANFSHPRKVGGCELFRPNGHCRLTAYLDWIQMVAGVAIRP
ncbi:Hypothetical predicted protein [Cloeon dipterum]|uniref:Peptidase S1 domain-containing protein n=1 Tax=Cloeon dipterum TaxID=197152 RepID=A0A8S1DB34_9INSE|nr:Hypothetical predicted protein [Cloeon dipterum]